MENAAIFRKAGGRNFAFIPCLNDSDDGMGVIRRVAVRELSGWI
jgi:ferrochelatase